MKRRRTVRPFIIFGMALALALALAMTMAMAPASLADSSSALFGAVNTIRAASQCPSLQPDPMVQRVAEMATQETSDYISHRSAVIPFQDPVPALKTIGYAGGTGELASGYGSTETDSIHGLVVTGATTIVNCALTRYGVSTQLDDQGFTLTALVLAAA